jgi:hypothetical protein
VIVPFGIYGLTSDQARPIIRKLIGENWPDVKRYRQCVYVVRVRGQVAIAYGARYSPVIYIGEGNAYTRLRGHSEWIASLLINAPSVEIEVHIAEIARKNNDKLYRFIEADLLRWFYEDLNCLPWFNQQREKSKEDYYKYDPDAKKELRKHTSIGQGNKFLWAIRPLPNNDQHRPYAKGQNQS